MKMKNNLHFNKMKIIIIFTVEWKNLVIIIIEFNFIKAIKFFYMENFIKKLKQYTDMKSILFKNVFLFPINQCRFR